MTRKQLSISVAVVALVAGLIARNTGAQQAVSPALPTGVAVVDLGYISTQCARFTAMMDQWKADYQRVNEAIMKQGESLQAAKEQLAKYRPGTAEYKQTEESVAKGSAQLSVQMQLQRKELIERQARVLHAIYQEIQQEVEAYATRHGIAAVLRFSGDQLNNVLDQAQRDSVEQVVWFNPAIDITPHVLAALNQKNAGIPGSAGQGPTAGAPFQPQR